VVIIEEKRVVVAPMSVIHKNSLSVGQHPLSSLASWAVGSWYRCIPPCLPGTWTLLFLSVGWGNSLVRYLKGNISYYNWFT